MDVDEIGKHCVLSERREICPSLTASEAPRENPSNTKYNFATYPTYHHMQND